MEEKKITLSKEMQEEMLKFFLRTSIPRIKKNSILSKQQNDGGKNEQKETEQK